MADPEALIRLRTVFEALQRLEFPEHPESDKLDAWLLELAELDGYLAGVASSVIGGVEPWTIVVAGIGPLASSLQEIAVASDGDRVILARCKEYADRLQQLRRVLIEVGCVARRE